MPRARTDISAFQLLTSTGISLLKLFIIALFYCAASFYIRNLTKALVLKVVFSAKCFLFSFLIFLVKNGFLILIKVASSESFLNFWTELLAYFCKSLNGYLFLT